MGQNLIQKMFGVEPDGVSSSTKKAIKDAEGESTPKVAAPAFEGMGGSTVDPKATVVLEDGRRITPESKAILDQMLKKRLENQRRGVGR